MSNLTPPPFPVPTQAQAAYYEQRWKQLNDLVIAHSEGALTYLLTVNGGAVAGMLAFIGAVTTIRQSTWALAALTIFALGLLLAGLSRVESLLHVRALQNKWKEDYQLFLTRQISWNQLIVQDDGRVKGRGWLAEVLGWASFACFVAGLIVTTVCLLRLPPAAGA